jgi:hypothetical protein
MRRKNDTLANGVANPVVADLDMFRAFVHRVVEIDQRDRTLVVDAQVDRVVNDESNFSEQRAQPRMGL